MKILVVEDEREITRRIVQYLRQEGYVCQVAYTARDAEEKLRTHDYDCILLDATFPDGHGIKTLEKLKAVGNLDGVIIISDKDSPDDKIRALNPGTYDHISKPLHLARLGALVSLVIRKKRFGGNNTIILHEITIDLLGKSVSACGKEVDLTRKEYDLLLFLISNKNRVVTKKCNRRTPLRRRCRSL